MSSIAHVVAFVHVSGRGSFRTVKAHGAFFFVCYPASSSVVCGVGGKARFWKCAGWGRRVDRVVVGFISSMLEDPSECSLVRVHWDFREEEDVRGVEVQ